jgi:asparagine synthase (glutamine-hydrolysing)
VLSQKGGGDEIAPSFFGTQAQRRRWLKQKLFAVPGSPVLLFLYRYVFRLGFLDGVPGLIYCGFQAVQMFHTKSKIYELRSKKDKPGMCGISGLVNCGSREVLARMTHVQKHRGPDDAGIWEQRFPDGAYIGLGSRRLAILDLSASGHMPMTNADRSVCITYNGEVYNFRELRGELEGKGYQFFSDTDTEVVLHLYEEEGPECVRRLNGIFAFAICDTRSGTSVVFAARDHFGVKPFYYWYRGRQVAFASEVKALLEVPGIAAELDWEALHQYLTFLWVPDPKTMFRGIFKLPTGHYALLKAGELVVTKYWDLTFPSKEHLYSRSEEDLAEEIRERFRRSVEAQMVSDVPIGAFLSAGLDSSSIVAMMTGATMQPVRTYTITFPRKYRVGETALDDPAVAARLARHLGCENEQIVVEPNVAELLPGENRV